MKTIPRFIAPMTFGESFAALFSSGSYGSAEPGFSKRFAEYLGVDYAIPAPSGRFAFAAILQALAFPKGGEIILPALTFHSIPQLIRQAGLVPVFVDIEPDTCCIDPVRIEAAVTNKTVAILPTHLYGRSCDMKAVGRIAEKRGLRIIEDCAQSCGGQWRGRKTGSIGDAAYFSFGPTKNLAVLWAGMVTTGSPEIAQKASAYFQSLEHISAFALSRRLVFALAMRFVTQPWFWRIFMAPALRWLSKKKIDPIEKLTAETPGAQNPADRKAGLMPSEYQWRIGFSQLAGLDQSNARRIENGVRLIELLQNVEGITAPRPAPDRENIFMSFPVQVENRDDFRQRLLALGVDTATGYMSVCPGMPEPDAQKIAPAAFEAMRKMVHLPVYPELSSADIERIAVAVKTVIIPN